MVTRQPLKGKRKSVIIGLLTGDLTEATRKTLERRLAELVDAATFTKQPFPAER